MNKPKAHKYQFMALLYSRGGKIKGVLTPGQLMIPCYVPGVDGLGFWFTGCIDCSDNDIRMINDSGNDDDDDDDDDKERDNDV